MQGSPSLLSRKNVWILSWYTSLALLLIFVSGCTRHQDMTPDGYGAIFKDPARSSTASRVDFPIVLTLDERDTSISFNVTKDGERVWFWNDSFWRQPFWTSPTWYRISLMDARTFGTICLTDWAKPADNGPETKIPCKLKDKNGKDATVKDHAAKPLIATLDYWVGGDELKPPGDDVLPTDEVARIYYFIPKY